MKIHRSRTALSAVAAFAMTASTALPASASVATRVSPITAQCELTPGAFDGQTVSAGILATAEAVGATYTFVNCWVEAADSWGQAAGGLPGTMAAAAGLAGIRLGVVAQLCVSAWAGHPILGFIETGDPICGPMVGGSGTVSIA